MNDNKPWKAIVLAALTALFGCVLACQGADPAARARAALALAAAQKTDCGCAPPPNYCTCGGDCACPNCKASHPRTCKAQDGGPDWTWDGVRGDWYRVIPLDPPATFVPAPAFFFQPPVAPVPFFAPRPVFSGGRGGC